MDNPKNKPSSEAERDQLQQRIAALEAENAQLRQQYAETSENLRTFQTLVEHTADGVALNNADTTFYYVNPAYQALSGHKDSLIGKTIFEIYSSSQEELGAAAEAAIANGSWQGRLALQRPDGTQLPCQVSVVTLYADSGEPQGFVAVARDMSEQQRAQEEREILQQQIIDTQSQMVRELSTPLIPIADQVVIMPLIGTIDSARAQMVMETLLEGIAQYQAELAILDITGVSAVDTQVAQALIQAARAVNLLGAQVMLTGIQPQIAQTLVQLGVDLGQIHTRGTLQAAIVEALREMENKELKE